MDEFNDMITICDLEDAFYVGDNFTWSNGRVWKRLDRVLHNEMWSDHFQSILVKHLPRTCSDHIPLLITSKSSQHMWTLHKDFNKVVEQNWNLPIPGSSMYIFWNKLKRLKLCLKDWNVNHFGNIFNALKQSEEEVGALEILFEENHDEVTRKALHHAKAKQLQIMAREEVL